MLKERRTPSNKRVTLHERDERENTYSRERSECEFSLFGDAAVTSPHMTAEERTIIGKSDKRRN